MFFSVQLITKGRPLFQCWVAANGTRLKSAQLAGVDCAAVAELIGNDGDTGQPLSLRFSSALMRGASRLIGWQFEALQKQAQAARMKLAIQVRKVSVTLADDALTAKHAHITLAEQPGQDDDQLLGTQPGLGMLEEVDGDWIQLNGVAGGGGFDQSGSTTAHRRDITLDDVQDEDELTFEVELGAFDISLDAEAAADAAFGAGFEGDDDQLPLDDGAGAEAEFEFGVMDTTDCEPPDEHEPPIDEHEQPDGEQPPADAVDHTRPKALQTRHIVPSTKSTRVKKRRRAQQSPFDENGVISLTGDELKHNLATGHDTLREATPLGQPGKKRRKDCSFFDKEAHPTDFGELRRELMSELDASEIEAPRSQEQEDQDYEEEFDGEAPPAGRSSSRQAALGASPIEPSVSGLDADELFDDPAVDGSHEMDVGFEQDDLQFDMSEVHDEDRSTAYRPSNDPYDASGDIVASFPTGLNEESQPSQLSQSLDKYSTDQTPFQKIMAEKLRGDPPEVKLLFTVQKMTKLQASNAFIGLLQMLTHGRATVKQPAAFGEITVGPPVCSV